MNKVLKQLACMTLVGGVAWSVAAEAQAASPTIKGATTKTVVLGGSFNAKTAVTAKDSKGKSLTSKIKITGKANFNKKGVYYYTYKVTSAKKETKTVKRKVIVAAKSHVLKQETRQFDFKGGYGRHATKNKGTKLSFYEKSTGGWYKTSAGYWVKDGIVGDYVYVGKTKKNYAKSTSKTSTKIMKHGIYKVLTTASNGMVKTPEGWLLKPEYVDLYATAGEEQQQQDILKIVNNERAKTGAQPLILDDTLSKTAIIRSSDMIKYKYFSHTSPNTGAFYTLVQQMDYAYWGLGENIAAGAGSGAAYMNMWMNSTGHRNNILNPNYNRIGIGVVKNTAGGFYSSVATQVFATQR
ncbi:CAP domain-containing protein [Kurthia sibirica]|uniref:SCP domain-containing protein n=1 Tax=Kurthia sibirica TaxID=202750 RepID=A0A2U3APF3_9BACL|nr:CAP domain-containing protein [Kurthia sibirica]PWI26389.1 hypothetical protein DEX24_03375 [Kurthia sibirica]GEK34174.1 hypothetical protein KSI01_17070 [Kurthia sibirica]